jgi:hypothetical protein
MEKRYFNKTLVIGIILLLTTVSIGSSYATRHENNGTVGMQEPINYLGEIIIIHTSPLHNLHFVKVIYKPVPVDKRDFYFPEVNGSVDMNFTVNCSHQLSVAWLHDRESNWIVFVSSENDYVIGSLTKPCISIDRETYTLNLTARIPLVTNGQDKKLTVYFYGGATVNGIRLIDWGYYPLMIFQIIPRLIWHCMFPITVHPT